MAWEASPTTVSITESTQTTWFLLSPKELAHIQFNRTGPVSPANATRIYVESSVDNGTTVDTVPIVEVELPASQDIVSFFVFGPKYFRVGMGEVGTGEVHTGDVSIIRDGGVA